MLVCVENHFALGLFVQLVLLFCLLYKVRHSGQSLLAYLKDVTTISDMGEFVDSLLQVFADNEKVER